MDYILRGSVNPNSETEEIGLLLHQAHIRLMQFASTPPHFRGAIMQPLPQFTLDPVLIASAIVDGIKSGVLSIEDLPPEHLEVWRSRPIGIDWSSGVVVLEQNRNTLMLTPTLALVELDSLFRQDVSMPSGAKDYEQSAEHENPVTPKLRNRTGPRPTEMERLKQAMRDMSLARLKEATLFELLTQLNAKQTSVRAAKIAILAEFDERERRTTPNNEK